jgi:hypothetical protein
MTETSELLISPHRGTVMMIPIESNTHDKLENSLGGEALL